MCRVSFHKSMVYNFMLSAAGPFWPSLFSGLDYWTGLLDWTTGLDYWTGLLDWTTGLDYWTGLLDWTTGLDYWTGLLDWTTGLDYWTGLLDWTTGLDHWTGLLDWTTGLTETASGGERNKTILRFTPPYRKAGLFSIALSM